MGIGNNFPQGMQVDWVLGSYSQEEMEVLQPSIVIATDIIKTTGSVEEIMQMIPMLDKLIEGLKQTNNNKFK